MELGKGMNQTHLFDDYASWTDLVAKYPATAEPFYLAMGITDELGELAAAETVGDVMDESGDALWYVARYVTKVLGNSFGDAVQDSRDLTNLTETLPMLTGVICGVEKKRIRDGEGWSNVKRIEKDATAYRAAIRIIRFIENEIHGSGGTLEAVLQRNVNKLSSRLDAGTIQGDGDKR